MHDYPSVEAITRIRNLEYKCRALQRRLRDAEEARDSLEKSVEDNHYKKALEEARASCLNAGSPDLAVTRVIAISSKALGVPIESTLNARVMEEGLEKILNLQGKPASPGEDWKHGYNTAIAMCKGIALASLYPTEAEEIRND